MEDPGWDAVVERLDAISLRLRMVQCQRCLSNKQGNLNDLGATYRNAVKLRGRMGAFMGAVAARVRATAEPPTVKSLWRVGEQTGLARSTLHMADDAAPLRRA